MNDQDASTGIGAEVPPDHEPRDTGSLGDQEPEASGMALAVDAIETPMGHVGALLRESLHDDSPFLRAVTFAALQDAEASRRFLERQLEASQTDVTDLGDRLGDALTQLAILRTVLGERSSQQVVFAIGAAAVGAGLGVAVVGEFAWRHVLIVALGIALMFFSRGTVSIKESE